VGIMMVWGLLGRKEKRVRRRRMLDLDRTMK
jgi:hypothetical protein